MESMGSFGGAVPALPSLAFQAHTTRSGNCFRGYHSWRYVLFKQLRPLFATFEKQVRRRKCPALSLGFTSAPRRPDIIIDLGVLPRICLVVFAADKAAHASFPFYRFRRNTPSATDKHPHDQILANFNIRIYI
jgi:hypothetical protein